MRTVVSGGRGFLGHAIVNGLNRVGSVTQIATRQRPVRSFDDDELLEISTLIWASAAVTPQVAQQNPTACDEEIEDFQIAIGRLLERSPSCRILFASSGGTVYDADQDPPYSESSKVDPNNRYGEMKLEMERFLAERGGTSLRLSNLYGPGQRARNGLGVIAHWLNAALKSEPVRLFGSGSIARDFVYVSDAAAAFVSAATTSTSLPSTLNIGSGRATALDELLEIIADVLSPEEFSVKREDSHRSYDRLATFLDIELAQKTLGWRPQTSLEQGIATTWERLRQN